MDIVVYGEGRTVFVQSIKQIRYFIDIHDIKWEWSDVYRCFVHKRPMYGKGQLETQLTVPKEVLFLALK